MSAPLRYLIVSDIHANWEALQAVLEASKSAYDRIICLGDLVGYGPDPNRVVEWAREHVSLTVRGNHDRVCVNLSGIEDLSPLAEESARWTAGQLETSNREYLQNLPAGPIKLESLSLVHGSPQDEDAYLPDVYTAAQAFPYVESDVTLFGHTHLQGGFEARKGRVRSIREGTGARKFPSFDFDTDADYLINPGSVGQPRDGCPDAAYLLLTPEERTVQYRRAAYPIATTQTKILRAGLPAALAARLSTGE